MARVAVCIVGAQDLANEVFRRGAAALAIRIGVQAVGPVMRGNGRAALVAIVRTDAGPSGLHRSLRNLQQDRELHFRLLSYGALIYRSDRLCVPPLEVDLLLPELESLQNLDPGFEIPLLGNVTAHLGRVSNRPQS